MKSCFVLLLVALHANTVGAMCECNTADVTIGTNQLFTQIIKCDTGDVNLPIDCTLTITGDEATTIAVAFPMTELDTEDTANNNAIFFNNNGDKVEEVSTTEVKELTATTQAPFNKATISIKLSQKGEIKIQYIAAVGAETDKACGDTRPEVIALTEDTCITTTNFPKNYQSSQTCSWTISPGNTLTTVDAEMRFMSVEASSPCDADIVKIETDGGTATENCGKTLQDQKWENVNSMKVSFTSDGEDEFPGFLMCFSLRRINPCTVDDPCNGGTCTPADDSSEFTCTNCPSGFTGERCNEEKPDPCKDVKCRRNKTCKPCNCDTQSGSNTKRKCRKQCCQQRRCKNPTVKKHKRKCKKIKMYYCE